MIIMEIFGVVFIGIVTAHGIKTYKQNKKMNEEIAKSVKEKGLSVKIVNNDSNREKYDGYPTKQEYEENIRQINKKELNSDRFKKTKEFITLLKKIENIDLEKKLFKIVGTYDIEDNGLVNKKYDEKRIIRSKRYNELKKFMNSLTTEQINSNLYLKATAKFMETSIIDCEMIIEKLRNQTNNLEISDKNKRYEVNIAIPEERLDLIPTTICEVIGIPYYKPQDYKVSYIDVLDKDNSYVYAEYNKYVNNIEKIARDVYFLQMWNLLSVYPEQIDNYYFSILNNSNEHEFRTAYFVKKCRESSISIKTESYQLSEKAKDNISRIVGLPFEDIVNMDFEDLEKHIEQKIGQRPTYDLRLRIDGIPMDEEHIITIEQVDEKSDEITTSPKLILKRKIKENSKN